MAAATNFAAGVRTVAVAIDCRDCDATHVSAFQKVTAAAPGFDAEADARTERFAAVDATPDAFDAGWCMDTDGALLCRACTNMGGA